MSLSNYEEGLPVVKGFSGKESVSSRRCKRCELILRLGRSPGGGNGKPLQYSCLENPKDRGVWWATVPGVTKSWSWLSEEADMQLWAKLVIWYSLNIQFSSVAQSCSTLCDPMNRSTPSLPVHHKLPEFTQTHVHQVSDAIQPSHPLSSPSLPALSPSQHQGLFQWVSSSHEVAKVLDFQPQRQSFQWTPRTDLL